MKKQKRSKAGNESFDYRLENDQRFLKRIAAVRESIRAGKGVRLEDIPKP